jgi:hypothetical protein
MSVADRRAPLKVRTFAVLYPFRYNGRRYEVGGTFDTRGDVPRHRLDKLWRDGCIGMADGSSPVVEEQPEELPVVEEVIEEVVVEEAAEETLYGEDHLD